MAKIKDQSTNAIDTGRHVAAISSNICSSDIVSYLMENKNLVDMELQSCLTSELQTSTIVSAMRYSLLAGGKRIRPILAIASYEMFAFRTTKRTNGGRTHDLRTVMPMALAVEMIHTMSLIHDDLPLMDNDDFRRGKPTNHKVYGDDIAILAGDALLAYAFEYIARKTPGGNAEAVVDCIKLLAGSVGPNGLAAGQVKDLESAVNGDVTIETLAWIHTYKTASLLRASCVCGAILGGAGKEDVTRLSTFANNIGLAFQIVDDVLDVTQRSEVLGKTSEKDRALNKATYPRFMEVDECTKEAERLVNDAKKVLVPYGSRANNLLGIADFILNRQN